MRNSYQLALTLLVYGIFCVLLYPFYRHLFDFDGIGYFAVIKHLAAGEWYEAINGYWSPLHCWLAAILYKMGLNEFDAMKIVCILAGAGILVMTHRLLKRTAAPRLATLATAILIVLCYVFCYQGPDILLCFLLLVYLEFIILEKYKPAAVIACLAFFAKAYAFPFFLIHYTVVSKPRKTWLWGIGIFLLMALPWMAALFYKYRFVTFGYSGKLNMQWVLYGYGLETRTLYALNPYPLSIHWKDPYSYPWNFTGHHEPTMLKRINVFFKNLRQFFTLLPFFSFLAAAIIPIMGIFRKKDKVLASIFWLLLIFPACYLLVALEVRYLFVMAFLLLVGGAVLLQMISPKKLWWGVFFASFLIFPIDSLMSSVHKGEEYFMMANQVKALRGKWITNSFDGYTQLARVAYLNNATLWQFPREPKNDTEILAASRQAGIDYYFHYCKSGFEAAAFRQTGLYKAALQEIKISDPNIIILKLR